MTPALRSWLQVAPLTLVLVAMVLAPLVLMVAVSFMDYGYAQVLPVFTLDNYRDLLTPQTLALYGKTFKFVAITWAATLFTGFTVAYFIVFHVRTRAWRTVFMLACAIPFWTSSVIRMIAWVPFLGREGMVNTALIRLGLVHEPLSVLLFSDFAVVLAYVHIMTLLMVAPIANAMGKIDASLLSAARDCGAGEFQILREIVVPLSRTGIALGSVFVVTQVMGDYFIVKAMSGSQAATAIGAVNNELTAFEYPPAAAGSVLMMAIVVALVFAVLRVVDIRKELTA